MALAQSSAQTTTTVALTSGGGPVSVITGGSTLTLTATVKAGSMPVSPGQVKFCDASATNCTDTHLLGSAQLTKAGAAVFRFRPAVGTHSYKAVFLGTKLEAASSSGPSSLTVTGTSTAIASSVSIAKTGSFGHYFLTGTTTEVGSTAPLNGSLSFLDTSHANTVLGTAPLGASVQGLTWINSQTPSVGFGPESITSADFNRDGTPDLAVVSSRGDSLRILLGNGDGTFASAVSAITVNDPVSVVAGDFNADGIPDLMVANLAGSGSVNVFLGAGDGTFTQLSSSPVVGVYPGAMTVADFNGDGIADVAVSDETNSEISILLGHGDGTFSSTQFTLTTSGCLSDIANGDFNGDGKADLIVTGNCEYDQGNTVIILLGSGDGTFTTGPIVQTGFDVDAVTVADFNGDGKPDIAVANGDGAALTTLLNNGDGTFTTANIGASFPTHSAFIASGDFNGDGIVDLALPDDYNNTVMIYQGIGDGTFAPAAISPATGNTPFALTVGDFNGDGRQDIAVVNNFDSTVTVVLAAPMMTATTAPTAVGPPVPGQHLVDASYPGDGNYNANVSATTLLWGQPPPTATTLSVSSGGRAVTSVPAGSTVTLTASVMTGSTPLTSGQVEFCDTPATTTSCAVPYLAGTGSLTSNGTASFQYVPGPGQHSYTAVLLENAGGAPSSSPASVLTVNAPPHVDAPTVASIFESGNIGNYTLSATVMGTGSHSPLTGNVSFLDTSNSNQILATAALGASTSGLGWPVSSIPFTDVGFLLIALGDFNRDGNPDVAAVNTNTMAVTILLGNGDGTFRTTAGPNLTTYTTAIVSADFNGDGKLDLAVSSVGEFYNSPGTLTIFLGNGDGTFQAASGSLPLGNPTTVFAAADFNGDGKIDLLVNDYATGTEVFLGNGDGTFAQVPALGFSATFAVADLNGDGFPDLVVGGGPAFNDSITIYLSNGDGTFRLEGEGLPLGAPAGSAVVGDFNGDGIPDLAASGATNSSVVVFLGKGDGTFTPVSGGPYPPIGAPAAMTAADLNQDGIQDLIIADWNDNPDLTFLLGNGDGTFTSIPGDTQLSATWSVVAADLNGDGVPDLAVGTASGFSALSTEPTQTATAAASGVAPSGPGPHLADASYPGDGNYQPSTSGTTSLDVQLATPVFSPASGNYNSIQTVTISDATPGATINYTTYGGNTGSSSIVYTGPIVVSSYETISAYASANGYIDSETATANYLVSLPASTPTFSPAGGTYTSIQTVNIADGTPGAMIFYTTDGSTPSTSSTSYSKPITVSSSEIIKAIATASQHTTSAVQTAAYTVNTPPPTTNPTPVLTSLSPAFTTAGSGSFSLTLNGSGFIPTSTAYWGTTALPSHYVSSTSLTAQVPSTNVSSAGVSAITVETPPPGGGTSSAVQFEVDTAGSTPPTFTSAKVSVTAGSTASYPVTLPSSATAVSLTCLNLPSGATCSYSASSGTVSISTSASTPAGTYQITVVFAETLPGESSAWIIVPLVLIPLAAARRRSKLMSASCILLTGLVLAVAATGFGCGGGGSTQMTNPTHQVTAAGTVTLVVQ